MTPHRLHARRRGLSLVELTIVLLVLGIAAALATPMLRHTDTTRLVEAAKLIEADLAFAQVESIAHGDDPRLVVFTPGDATPRYHLAPASAATVPITNPVGHGPYRVTFGRGRAAELAGVTLASVTPSATLRFGIYGQLCPAANPGANLGSDAVITLACNGRSLQLTIDDVTGDVTIGQVR